MLTIGHELGHVLGAGHRASQYTGSQGIGYGYHNQEPLYRRNDAYGLDVSQHGQKFYSLMSYANYKNENNQNRGCTDCTQLNAFSSPDLWWFFDQMDPQHGFCLVLDDTDPAAISMQCNIAEPCQTLNKRLNIEHTEVRQDEMRGSAPWVRNDNRLSM